MDKSHIKKVLDKMPEEINIGDFIAELSFREKLEKGLKQTEEGKTLTHNQAKEKFSKWLD